MNELIFCGIGSALETDFNSNCAYFCDKNEIVVIDPSEKCVRHLVNNEVINENTRKVTIVVTHTHCDHISGLGQLIWQCAIKRNIIPTIIANSNKFKKTLKKLLQLSGVDKNYFTFSKNHFYKTENVSIEMVKTTHTEDLESFSIIIKDCKDKIYYSGDTNNFEQVKHVILDESFTKVYLELSHYPKSHIEYNDIKKLSNLDKVVAMHLTKELYKEILDDGIIKIAKEI